MSNIRKQTLAEQVYHILKDDIIRQTIPAGSKITIKMLQERFDLSSTPIREAMNRLSQEGLLEHITNIGAKVICLTANDVIEIYDLCQILDSAALDFAYHSNKSTNLLIDLGENIDRQKKALDQHDLDAFRDASDDFHDIFFKYANNLRLFNSSLRIRNQLSILVYRYQNFEQAKDLTFFEHLEIYNALASGQYEKAVEFLSTHFKNGKMKMLEMMR